MSVSPDTDRGLERIADKQNTNGWRLLGLAAILFVLGLIILAVGEDVANFAGLALMALSAPPAMAGLGLVLSGVVGKRSAQHKDFV
jgi:hypothetical protein